MTFRVNPLVRMDGKAVRRSRKIARHAGHAVIGIRGWSDCYVISRPTGAKRKTVIRSSKFETFPTFNNMCIYI